MNRKASFNGIFLYLLLVSYIIKGQSHKIIGGVGFLKMGYTYMPSSNDVFNKIAPNNITGFTNHNYILGAEGYLRITKIILAFDGNLASQKKRSTLVNHSVGKREADVYSGVALLKFGRIVKETKSFWFYPSAGFGISRIGMSTYSYSNFGKYDVQDYILNNSVLDFGLNTDINISPYNPTNTFGAFMIGARVGYRIGLGATDNWIDNHGISIANLPKYNFQGIYFTLNIGNGGFVRKQ